MKRVKFRLVTLATLLMCSWSFAQNCDEKKSNTLVAVVDGTKFEYESNFENSQTSTINDISSLAAEKNPDNAAQRMIPKVEVDVINMPIDNAGKVIVIGTLITALISIILAIITFRMQKQHNIKSVKPIGYIEMNYKEDNFYVRIVNNGIGPLLIKKLIVLTSKKDIDDYAKIEEKDWQQYPSKNLIDIIPTEITDKISYWENRTTGTVNRAIKPGDELYLLRLMKPHNNQEGVADLINYLKNCYLGLIYEDIYGNIQKDNVKSYMKYLEDSERLMKK